MKKKAIIYIVWKPLFAAIMTGIISKVSSIDPCIIGLLLGTAASAACYLDIKNYFGIMRRNKTEKV